MKEFLRLCTRMVQKNSHKDVGKRFYLNMEVSSRHLLNLTDFARIKQKLEFKRTRNRFLDS